jgi:hypothetical protein
MLFDPRSDRLTDPHTLLHSADNCLIDEPAGLLRHTKAAGVDFRPHFFGRLPYERQLEVMNDHCSVHGQRSNDAALYEIDENCVQADLRRVSAHTDDHGFPVEAGLCNLFCNFVERPRGQDVGQSRQKAAQAPPGPPRFCRRRQLHFAMSCR